MRHLYIALLVAAFVANVWFGAADLVGAVACGLTYAFGIAIVALYLCGGGK